MMNHPTSFKDWQSYFSKLDPLYYPAKVIIVEEIPKLGSGKTDFSATKKIALVNDQ